MSGARMDRRAFCRRLPRLSAGIALGAGVLPLGGCAGVPHLSPGRADGQLFVAATDVPAGGALLQSPDMARPVFVRRAADGEYIALLAECTHRGCQPDPVGDRLVCPCHGSEFDLEGAVLEGPADRPLTRYPARRQGDRVIVAIPGGGR